VNGVIRGRQVTRARQLCLYVLKTHRFPSWLALPVPFAPFRTCHDFTAFTGSKSHRFALACVCPSETAPFRPLFQIPLFCFYETQAQFKNWLHKRQGADARGFDPRVP
jgi:hypothetical protein